MVPILLSNLFYDMQSKLKNKFVLPKDTWSPLYNFPEYIFSSTYIIWTRARFQLVQISEVLL
jgi:hypothetical protein